MSEQIKTQEDATSPFRIRKDLLEKAKYISKKQGRTISGYLNLKLEKLIESDWNKFNKPKP